MQFLKNLLYPISEEYITQTKKDPYWELISIKSYEQHGFNKMRVFEGNINSWIFKNPSFF